MDSPGLFPVGGVVQFNAVFSIANFVRIFKVGAMFIRQ